MSNNLMRNSTTADNSQLPDGGEVIFADAQAAALLADRVAELYHPEDAGFRRVKHNASRTVYCGRIDGEEIYLKQFHSQSPLHRLALRIGLSDARFEMRISQYLSAAGVPTPHALASAAGAKGQWLATRAVTDSRRADLWHAEQVAAGRDGQRKIRKALVRLARIVGKMHAAGVIHDDLHCGNVLVRTLGGGDRLVLMDLHRARRRRRLSRRARTANLAQLLHDRYELTTRTQRLRFLRHYLRATGAEGTLRGWQIMIEEFARRHRGRQYAQRDRRIFGENRYFAPLRPAPGWRAHAVLASKRHMAGSTAAGIEFTREDWMGALARPDALFEGEGATVLKKSRSGSVIRRRLKVGPHELDVVVKRPRRKHAWKLLADCFRPARAMRAFRLGHALLTRRIATSLPLAAMERRRGPFLLDSIIITEAVDAPQLGVFLGTWLAQPPQGDVRLDADQQHQLAQEVLAQLGRMVRNLHDGNFAHRDLKAANILVRWSPPETPEVVLVDMDGLREVRFLTDRRKFQGLMRLNVSLLQCPQVNHAGRLRMLLGYLRRPGCGRINFKPFWRVLEQWSARKIRRQIRSRRRRQKSARRPAR